MTQPPGCAIGTGTGDRFVSCAFCEGAVATEKPRGAGVGELYTC